MADISSLLRKEVVKGVSQRVIVINSPAHGMFRKIIFVVKEDAFREAGVNEKEVLDQARQAASVYVGGNTIRDVFRRLFPVLCLLVGAVIGIVIGHHGFL